MTTLLDDARTGATLQLTSAAMRALAWTGDPFARLDVHRPGLDDPFEIMRSIRDDGRLVRSRAGVWITASHDVCRTVFRSPHASSRGDGSLGPQPLDDSFIGMDAPDHTRLRRLVSLAFTPKAIAGHRERICDVANELLDACPTDRPIDFITDFAAPLPMAVICDLLGLPPSERARFFHWGEVLIAALDRTRTLDTARRVRLADAELRSYLAAVVAERRRRPADDLISALARAADDEDRLSDDEIVSTLTLLLIAGFETTVNLIGTGTLNLLRSPDQLALVVSDPERRVANLVEEALRFEGAVMFTFRTALAPIDLGEDAVVPVGATVVLGLAGANRDPAVFSSPEVFDVQRENACEHLAFASGAHYCLGAALARLEAETAWQTLLTRHPSLRLSGAPTYRPSPIIRGLDHLPVTLGS
ncbi:MAG TPA: cytochrome P450 [Ilumatobacteraceae bacterium]|nr:cytochrome P450 [Ilumatobacteraceae bacterium]